LDQVWGGCFGGFLDWFTE